MKRQLSAPFVCFACRKVFKRPIYRRGIDHYEPINHQPVCPQCHHDLLKIGDTFRAPRRIDVAAWRVVQRDSLKGRRFVEHENFPPKPSVPPRLRTPKGVFSLFQLPARKRRK